MASARGSFGLMILGGMLALAGADTAAADQRATVTFSNGQINLVGNNNHNDLSLHDATGKPGVPAGKPIRVHEDAGSIALGGPGGGCVRGGSAEFNNPTNAYCPVPGLVVVDLKNGPNQLLGVAASLSISVTGGSENDLIWGSPNASLQAFGGGGNDDIIAWGSGGRVFGLFWWNDLHGGGGKDFIATSAAGLVAGDAGVDQLFGSDDSDIIDSFDGAKDKVVECRAGNGDLIHADPVDPITNCETPF